MTMVYFNNHSVGQAPADARQLAALLAKEGARLSPKSKEKVKEAKSG